MDRGLQNSKYPNAILEYVFDSPKVNPFCAFREVRVAMRLANTQIHEHSQYGMVYYQQDSAPPHYFTEI